MPVAIGSHRGRDTRCGKGSSPGFGYKSDPSAGTAADGKRANGGHVEIRPPKYGSERTVYVADGLVEILAAHVAARCPRDDPARYLFGKDVPPHQNTVGHWWRRARRVAGCSAVKLHGLRHFYASGLIAAGCDVVTVQRALGHASATVTLNTYAHLWPTAEDRTQAAAAAMLAETLSVADSVRTSGQR